MSQYLALSIRLRRFQCDRPTAVLMSTHNLYFKQKYEQFSFLFFFFFFLFFFFFCFLVVNFSVYWNRHISVMFLAIDPYLSC